MYFWFFVTDPDTNQVSAIFWDLPVEEQYVWKFEKPSKPRTLRIYECHIGISSQTPNISSFNEFTDQVSQMAKCLATIWLLLHDFFIFLNSSMSLVVFLYFPLIEFVTSKVSGDFSLLIFILLFTGYHHL